MSGGIGEGAGKKENCFDRDRVRERGEERKKEKLIKMGKKLGT